MNMRRACFLPFAIMIVSSAIAAGRGGERRDADSARIVATVGNESISLQSYVNRYDDYLIWSGVQDNMQARFAVLNNMVNEILLERYDDNSRIYNNPEYKKEINWAKKSTLLAFLKDREVYAKITASEEELRDAYVRSKTKVAVRHLYAPTLKEADELYILLMMGVSFKELARQTFTDTTLMNNGGYLGYISFGETDPNFEDAAFHMRVGEISRPVKTAEGYSIIKVEDKIQDPFTTEDEFVRMRHKLERAVRISKKSACEEAYLAKVFDKTKVKFNDRALSYILDEIAKDGNGRINVESSEKTAPHYGFCAEYKGRIYSVEGIASKLSEVPDYNLRLLTSLKTVKEAVLGIIMQGVLLKIAREKGYDTSSYVRETFSKLKNDIFLKYKRNEILAKVPVSDSELMKYYRDNIGYYSTEDEMNIQEIIVQDDSAASELGKRIEHGMDFGTLATRYSVRKWSAVNRGVMGLTPVSRFGSLRDTLWNSQVGRIIGPIKFDKYYGLFRVLEKKAGRPLEISLVKQSIINAIKNEKGFPYMKRHLEELSKRTIVRINDDLVKTYEMDSAE